MVFPTYFPSFWTQADIDRYRELWLLRESQGLPNPDPWWIGNPDWSEGPISLLPGSPTAVISSPGIIPGSGEGSPGELAGTTPTKYASMEDLTRLGLVSGKETDANLAITKYGEGFITYDVTKPPDVKPGYYNSIFDPNVYAPELKQTTTAADKKPASGTGDLIGLGILVILGLGVGRSRTRTQARTRSRKRVR